MKKSYISILLLAMVMILAISAVSAADDTNSSDSDLQAVDEAPIEEVASEDVDALAATDDVAVVAAPGDKNFTQLQAEIDQSTTGMITLESNYVRQDGESDIEISKNFNIFGDDVYTIDANNKGGIFKINQGSSVLLSNVVLINGNGINGGAIYNEGTVNIISSTLTGNTASCGGAIFNTNIATISGSTLNENTATDKGGAVYSTGTLVVSDGTKFNDNTATDKGGAIYSEGTLDVTGTTFDSNNITHRDGSYTNNYGGAAIYNLDGTLSVTESRFNNNIKDYVIRGTNGGNGDIIDGAITTSGTVTITNSNFTGNGGTYGSAITMTPLSANKDGSITIDNCKFNDNIGYAGTVQISGGNFDIEIINSWFENNQAVGVGSPNYSSSGAALVILDNTKKGTIAGTTFKGNKVTNPAATPNGGAVCIQRTNADIDDCTFENNYADNDGGAIDVNGGSVTITGSEFINNTAKANGGAITVLNNVDLTLTDCNFTENKATASGGAVMFYQSPNLVVNNVKFEDNEAKTAGALYVYTNEGGIATVSNTEFISNEVTGNGGAIFCYSPNGTLNINDNTNFTDNKAGNTGGAILAGVGDVNIEDVTFTGNTANNTGGAIHARSTSVTSVEDSTFTGNTATNGSAIYNDGGKLALSGNDISKTSEDVYSKTGSISPVNVTVTINGADSYLYAIEEDLILNATITDVDGNLIKVDNFRFKLTSPDGTTEYSPYATYLGEGKYNATFNPVEDLNYIVSVVFDGSTDVVYNTVTARLITIKGTFRDLQNKIDLAIANNEDLNLTYNFAYTTGVDDMTGFDFTNGIIIDTPLTINGNNHIISGNDTVRIFYIVPQATVSLNNIVFKEGKAIYGAAIYAAGKVTIDNCTFSDNNAVLGNAIYVPNYQVFVVNDEDSYNAAYNGPSSPLAYYYAANPTEDIDTNDPRGHSWAATKAASDFYGPTLPWVVIGFDENFYGTIEIKYDDQRLIFGSLDGSYGFVIFSVKNTLGLDPDTFDPNKLEVVLVDGITNPENVFVVNDEDSYNAAYDGPGSALAKYYATYPDEDVDTNDSRGHSWNATKAASDNYIYGPTLPWVVLNIENYTGRFIFNYDGEFAFWKWDTTNKDFLIVSVPNDLKIPIDQFDPTKLEVLFAGSSNTINSAVYSLKTTNVIGVNIINSVFTNNGDANDYAIYNAGILSLTGNEIDNIIYDYGVITPTNITVMENGTYNFSFKNINLTATVIDDNGNPIYIPDLNFLVGTDEVIATYDYDARVYVAQYAPTSEGKFIVSMNTTLAVNTATVSFTRSLIDIQNMVNAASAGDTINLTGDYTYIEEFDSSIKNGIVIDKVITIDGKGFTIDANNAARIFNIINNAELTLTNVTLTKGNATDGGAVYVEAGATLNANYVEFNENTAKYRGGAIWSKGTVNIDNSAFDSNNITYRETNDDYGGAAIYNNGTLTVNNSDFTNNLKNYVVRTGDANNPQLIDAVVLSTGVSAVINNSYFENNSGTYGGAIAALPMSASTSLIVENSEFVNNLAYCGAAIYVGSGTTNFNIKNSTFIGNNATGKGSKNFDASGGAIRLTRGANGNITDSKFYNNTAAIGGAVSVGATRNTVKLTIDNCDFKDNTAAGSSTNQAIGGAIYIHPDNDGVPVDVAVKNSNFTTNAAVDGGSAIYNDGTLTLSGNNVTSGKTEIFVGAKGAVTSTIKVTILDGEIKTINSLEAKLYAKVTDDTGVNLIEDAKFNFTINGEEVPAVYDNGLYKANYTLPTSGIYPVNITYVTDGKNLEVANATLISTYGTFTDLAAQIANAVGTLDLTYNFTYTPEIDGAYANGIIIYKDVTINGNGSCISGANATRIFAIDTFATVNLNNITFKDGKADQGGAIYAAGILNIDACQFINNTAREGNAIYVPKEYTIYIINSEETYNALLNDPTSPLNKYYIDNPREDGIDANGNPVHDLTTEIVGHSWQSAITANAVNVPDGKTKFPWIVINMNKFNGVVYVDFNGTNVFGPWNLTGRDKMWAIISVPASDDCKMVEYALDKGTGNADKELETSLFVIKLDAEEFTTSTAIDNTVSIKNSVFTNNGEATDYAVYNLGTLKLLGGNSVDNLIYNNGTLDATINATLIDGQNVTATLEEIVTPNATLTDVDGNAIYAPEFKIVVGGDELNTTYDEVNRVYTATYTILTAGDKVVTTNYVVNPIEGKYLVDRANVTAFIVSVEDIAENETAIINVTLIGVNDNGLTRNVTVIVNNTKYTIEVINGTGIQTIANLTHGQYPVTAMFEDDQGNYNDAINSTVFYVKGETVLTVDPVTIVANYSEQFNFTFSLTDKQGNNLTGIVVIEGTFNVFVEDGIGYFLVDIEPDVGTYNYTAVYAGNNELFGSSVNFTFEIIPKVLSEPEVLIDAVGSYPDNVTFYIWGPDANYTVKVDDQNVTVEVIGGYGAANITGLTAGVKLANITIEDTNYKLNDSVSKYEFSYKKDVEFNITFNATYPNAVVAISNANVDGNYTVKIDDEHYVIIEVKDGAGEGTISGLNATDYPAFISFNETDEYMEYYDWEVIPVEKANATVHVFADDIIAGQNATITVYVTHSDGYWVNTTVKVTVYGETYDVDVIDGEGTVNVTGLPADFYDVSATLTDDNYNFVADSFRFYVKLNTTLTVSLDKNEYEYGDVIEITVSLVDSNGVGVNGTVNINGKDYIIEDGILILPIDNQPDVGEYYVFATYAGDDDYWKSESENVTFNVTAKVINPDDVTVEIPTINEFGDNIPVNITSPVDGNYTVNVNGTIVTVEVIDHFGTANITGLASGIYNATVDIDDANYSMATITTDDFEYFTTPEYNVIITGTYPNAEIQIFGTAGTYLVDIDGFSTINVTVSGYGLPGVYTIGNISAGNYTAWVSYPANDEYYGYVKDYNFTVFKAGSNVTIEPIEDVIYGNPIVIYYNIENETDFVTISIEDDKGNLYSDRIVTDTNITVNLPAGSYTINIHNGESEDYNESEAFAYFNVIKAQALNIEILNKTTVGVITTITANITVGPNATGKLFINKDGMSELVDLLDGGYYYLEDVVSHGDYYFIDVKYLGDANYNETNASEIVDIVFTNVVTNETFFGYFDPEGVLLDAVEFDELIFKGNFSDLGVSVININRPIIIYGEEDNAFYDMGLHIEADGVVAHDLAFLSLETNFTEFNDGAVIFVNGEDVTLYNMTVAYRAPEDVDAYAVYVANSYEVSLMDSEIYFIGNENNTEHYQYGLKVVDSDDVYIAENTILAKLPTRDVRSSYVYPDLSGIDQDLVLAVGIQTSDKVTFSQNKVGVNVISGLAGDHPTLDAIMVDTASELEISDNFIGITDFNNTGIACYYAVDLYSFDGTVENNNIVVITTTGVVGAGTAYPIQMNGPFEVTVINNNLTAVSNGPSAGIMTANWNGYANLIAEFNNITVVGSADSSAYALTTGIELQVNVANINNNIINVTNIGEYADDNNIYGISNAQAFLLGTLDIQDNEVYTNGKYAVLITDNVEDSTVTGNYLIAQELYGDYAVNDIGDVDVYDNFPADLDIAVYVEDCEVSDPIEIYVYTNELFSGNVTVTVDGHDYDVEIIDGEGNLTLSSLPASNYTVTATYDGDLFFTNGTDNYTFEVYKHESNLTITVGDIVIDQELEVNITLPFADGNVTIYFDNADPVIVELIDGDGNFTIAKDKVTAGEHYIYALFTGNDDYEFADALYNYTVDKQDIYPFDVNITVDEMDIREDLTFNVTLPEDANGELNVTVDGEHAASADVVNGTATVTVPASAFTAGENNTINVTYSDDKYGETTVSKDIFVNKLAANLTASADNITVGSDAVIIVSITTADDGTLVVVTVDDRDYPVALENGVGNVTISGLAEGNYTAIVTLEDDPVFEDNQTEVAFTVSKVEISPEDAFNVTTPENATSPVFTVNLPSDAKGYLLVDVDGNRTFVELVNGTATVPTPKLNPGEYNATVTYTGDEKYAPISMVVPITVESNVPENAITIPENSNTSDPTFSINLPEDAGGYLEVDVDGKKYVAPVVNGKASVTVPGLSDGQHTVTVSYSGDGKYDAITKTATITVKDQSKANPAPTPTATKTATKIVAKKKKTYKAKKKVKKFTITLKTKSGKVIKKAKVTLKLKVKKSKKAKKSKKSKKAKTKTFKAKTNKKGKATFKIKKFKKKGTYIATIKYNGSKLYKACTKKVKIVIK